VPVIEPILDGSVALVAPLRYGAGMKGKIGQALAHGLPVITTSVGAQGFGLVHEHDALLAETPEEFAEAIERLLSDAELWERLSANGRAVIERTCAAPIIERCVRDLLELAGVGVKP
jgi:glycosyltransferase involved in cell wall biosynthesis